MNTIKTERNEQSQSWVKELSKKIAEETFCFLLKVAYFLENSPRNKAESKQQKKYAKLAKSFAALANRIESDIERDCIDSFEVSIAQNELSPLIQTYRQASDALSSAAITGQIPPESEEVIKKAVELFKSRL
ncbi:MAG: hypothetical protein KDD56_06200 [Bdellovibrionales bacterium]|nr:hypothetical protein [Bdellovibrionales bacterium]